MTKVYYIEGKKIDLDSSEWNLIYEDGRWSSEGINYYHRKSDDKFIIERWTNFQGRVNKVEEQTRETIIRVLLNERHPERIHNALETIKAKIEKF